MRRFSVLFVLFVAALPSVTNGQAERFPYEAEVRGDDVHIRSGPSLRHYPTGKLKQGDRVTVIRHDPGGWFMIAPPPGSFSWIDASLVRKIDERTGVVRLPPLENGQSAPALVRVGSTLSDECSLFSVQLDADDQVEILGEKTLNLDRGPVLMYQIAPPAQEFRWVKGDYIAPVAASERAATGDPFAVPAPPRLEVGTPTFSNGPTVDVAHAGPGEDGRAASEPVAPLSNDLDVLDRQLTENLAQDPAQWRLDEFEQRFRELLPMSDPVHASLIRQRLAAIAARKQAQADYIDFVRLTTETTLREQQLQALQFGGIPAQPAGYPQVQLGAPQPIPDGTPAPASLPGSPPGGTPRLPSRIAPIPERSHGEPPAGPVMPRFDGAGIIQRSGNPLGTVPPYVLISPTGKLLAFLEPGPGTNLEPYVGRSMGVIGTRGFDARLQADRIVVRRLQAVQLAP